MYENNMKAVKKKKRKKTVMVMLYYIGVCITSPRFADVSQTTGWARYGKDLLFTFSINLSPIIVFRQNDVSLLQQPLPYSD
jgi:hypothetical protein